MFLLNTTYVITEKKVPSWKKWLKEDAFAKSVSPAYTVYKINHQTEDGQVSFAVQFSFETLDLLAAFQKELDKIHEESLFRIMGNECLFFSTVLSHEVF